jgi:hypothetical protein
MVGKTPDLPMVVRYERRPRMQPDQHYWFPAKRYGWGWGIPATWQGWLVFVGFFVLLLAGVFLFPPQKMLAAYVAYIAVLSLLLVGICWLKGEPPRWRWGGD